MQRIEYVTARLSENTALGGGAFVLRIAGCEFLAGALPGQFVMLRSLSWGGDPLLARAFSLLAVHPDGSADVLVKAAGKASTLLERALPGAELSLLGPLGNTFPAPEAGRQDWLIAGGVGFAPLMMHAARARASGSAEQVTMFYGGRSQTDLVLSESLVATGARLICATEDGSRGAHGYVTAPVEEALAGHKGPPPTLMACGPEPMLEAVAGLAHRAGVPCYLSVEGEMACGIGACLVCAIPCKSTPFRYACIHGPVFELSDLGGRYAGGKETP